MIRIREMKYSDILRQMEKVDIHSKEAQILWAEANAMAGKYKEVLILKIRFIKIGSQDI